MLFANTARVRGCSVRTTRVHGPWRPVVLTGSVDRRPWLQGPWTRVFKMTPVLDTCVYGPWTRVVCRDMTPQGVAAQVVLHCSKMLPCLLETTMNYYRATHKCKARYMHRRRVVHTNVLYGNGWTRLQAISTVLSPRESSSIGLKQNRYIAQTERDRQISRE